MGWKGLFAVFTPVQLYTTSYAGIILKEVTEMLELHYEWMPIPLLWWVG